MNDLYVPEEIEPIKAKQWHHWQTEIAVPFVKFLIYNNLDFRFDPAGDGIEVDVFFNGKLVATVEDNQWLILHPGNKFEVMYPAAFKQSYRPWS